MHFEGFPPVADPRARVLVLGSLQGPVSLRERQYYAQPRNSFWRIMGVLFGAALERPYEEALVVACGTSDENAAAATSEKVLHVYN
jgi:hypoxanthine-DNA glycosylase